MITLNAIAQRMAQDLLANHSDRLSDRWPAVSGDPIATVLNIESLAFQASTGCPGDIESLTIWFKAIICVGLFRQTCTDWMFFVDKPTPVLGTLVNWLLSYHRFLLRIEPGVADSYYVYISLGEQQ
jgi:hypothetical protein